MWSFNIYLREKSAKPEKTNKSKFCVNFYDKGHQREIN